MDTFLFLDITDRKKLIALARSKQLSVSTASGIIIKWYFYSIANFYNESYIHKGEHQLHIKIRKVEQTYIKNGIDTTYKVTTLIATNCIYAYLHNNKVKLPQGLTYTKINREIQREMDTTYDKNENKNVEIRASYRAKMENQR